MLTEFLIVERPLMAFINALKKGGVKIMPPHFVTRQGVTWSSCTSIGQKSAYSEHLYIKKVT
jgi:hypothetical protein